MVNSFKRTDSWEYFFKTAIVTCGKYSEGSKIVVGDKLGNLIIFNFMKGVDSTKSCQIPQNRKYDPVISIAITDDPKVDDEGQLILSCSQDRDLRLWRRSDGIYIKKYDLSIFLGEFV